MRLRRVTCPYCGKTMGVQVPWGGDGSIDVFPRHVPKDLGTTKFYCDGSRAEVPNSSYITEES